MLLPTKNNNRSHRSSWPNSSHFLSRFCFCVLEFGSERKSPNLSEHRSGEQKGNWISILRRSVAYSMPTCTVGWPSLVCTQDGSRERGQQGQRAAGTTGTAGTAGRQDSREREKHDRRQKAVEVGQQVDRDMDSSAPLVVESIWREGIR